MPRFDRKQREIRPLPVLYDKKRVERAIASVRYMENNVIAAFGPNSDKSKFTFLRALNATRQIENAFSLNDLEGHLGEEDANGFDAAITVARSWKRAWDKFYRDANTESIQLNLLKIKYSVDDVAEDNDERMGEFSMALDNIMNTIRSEENPGKYTEI